MKMRLYVTDRDEDSVICFSYDGHQLWELKYINELKVPVRISTDKKGNVYVSNECSSNIIVISSDEKQRKAILKGGDDLGEPAGIYYDKVKDQLLVAGAFGKSYLYQVK